MGEHEHEFVIECDHCKESFSFEIDTPIAVRCRHCNSVFDARLQLAKKSRQVSTGQ